LHLRSFLRRDRRTLEQLSTRDAERRQRMELTQPMKGLARVPRERGQSSVERARVPQQQARTGSLEARALGLGWFSIGLGLAQLIAPRQVARLIGADEDDATTRTAMMAVGVRELTCGVGLLSEKRPAAWAWARVVGDVMDLALLGYSWQQHGASRDRMLSVGGSVLGCALVDAQTAVALGREKTAPLARGMLVRQSVTIWKPAGEVYAYFRDLDNLPRFMAHLESVVETGSTSHWCARGPLGARVEWDAELIEDSPGERIAWRSLAGADVSNRGRVDFRAAPGGRGTEVIVELSYEPPAGAVGVAIAKLFGKEPAQEISADLRRLKQVLETGETIHSDASIHSGMHAARPSRESKVVNRKL
jgi:uncharacterized membrane protein